MLPLQRTGEGEYCVSLASGINQSTTNIIPVLESAYGDSENNDHVAAGLGGCVGFKVETFNTAGTADDAGLSFMIP